jgi:hypothetical protein
VELAGEGGGGVLGGADAPDLVGVAALGEGGGALVEGGVPGDGGEVDAVAEGAAADDAEGVPVDGAGGDGDAEGDSAGLALGDRGDAGAADPVGDSDRRGGVGVGNDEGAKALGGVGAGFDAVTEAEGVGEAVTGVGDDGGEPGPSSVGDIQWPGPMTNWTGTPAGVLAGTSARTVRVTWPSKRQASM